MNPRVSTFFLSILIVLLGSCSEESSPSLPPTPPSAAAPLFQLLPSTSSGLQFNNLMQENLTVNYLRYDGVYMGGGVGGGDLNNDGLDDV
ncbi:MAG: hypothetical protein AAGD05_07895, partial [Bacteroidota bacterium]